MNERNFMTEIITCSPCQLRVDEVALAAERANALPKGPGSPVERLRAASAFFDQQPNRLAIAANRAWKTKGVHLTVGFLDTQDVALRQRILSHMNAWGAKADVKFTESNTDPQVRIARDPNSPLGRYWSYVGTDILGIKAGQPTMNLADFSMATPDREYLRVVRHEAGHTLGFPHEHMRRELVKRIDPAKAKVYYLRTNNWPPAKVVAQVLTPIEDTSVRGTLHADPNSIMCYQIPAEITVDNKAIQGGIDIDASDHAFAAICYPRA
jgi:hypothetical protein